MSTFYVHFNQDTVTTDEYVDEYEEFEDNQDVCIVLNCNIQSDNDNFFIITQANDLAIIIGVATGCIGCTCTPP